MPNRPMTLGKLIELARRRVDMRQQDLADAVGVSRQLVGRWEADESCPDANQVRLIIAATGQTALVEWFTAEDDFLYVREPEVARSGVGFTLPDAA